MNEAKPITDLLGMLSPNLAAPKQGTTQDHMQQQMPLEKVQGHGDSERQVLTDLSQLEPGHECFVELYGRFYPATVTRQFTNDKVVQVKTEAAAQVIRAWKHLSFRWRDGRADSLKEGCRIVMERPAEKTPASDTDTMPDELTSYADPQPGVELSCFEPV